MADKYKIATKVPWEIGPRDWSHDYSTIDGVVDELMSRARSHQGERFDERLRGDQHWGVERTLTNTRPPVEHALARASFGDIEQVRALSDKVQWWIRKLRDVDPVVNMSETNYHIDILYDWIFKERSYPGIENWGTCNRRYIAGTTEWSQHCPWYALSGRPETAGCNALDIHGSHDVMFSLSRDLAGRDHVAKVLFYDHEWTPQTGWIYANVDHYDHVHVEGPRDHGGLAPACNY